MLLREVVKKVAEKGYSVGNADVTIVAQRPKMLPYIEQMRKNVADDLNVGIDDVNIKATTTENSALRAEVRAFLQRRLY